MVVVVDPAVVDLVGERPQDNQFPTYIEVVRVRRRDGEEVVFWTKTIGLNCNVGIKVSYPRIYIFSDLKLSGGSVF